MVNLVRVTGIFDIVIIFLAGIGIHMKLVEIQEFGWDLEIWSLFVSEEKIFFPQTLRVQCLFKAGT